ncbi:MAG: murein transglycosylase A, partial [Candidatus Binatia bacterium]
TQVLKEEPRLFQDDLDQVTLRRAIQHSLEFLSKLSPGTLVGEQPRKITAEEIRTSLLSFLDLLDLWDQPELFAKEIRSRFDLLQLDRNTLEGKALFTGYYQPIIDGSLTKTPLYRFPLYRKPDDLIEVDLGSFRTRFRGEKLVGRRDGHRLVPYLSRREIDALGRLKGKGYEIAWVKDAIDLFFLQIQGSGILHLEDGRLINLNYAASNGRPYRSIGRILVDSGKISEEGLSMQRLRRYLLEHPGERDKILHQNESYVFFRIVDRGPLGSLEVPLTPGRSIATDAHFYPRGALCFIMARKPILDAIGNVVRWEPFSRFVLNQDTGSAILGPGRADLYFGSGYNAGLAAGNMKSSGQIYFLIQKKAVQSPTVKTEAETSFVSGQYPGRFRGKS